MNPIEIAFIILAFGSYFQHSRQKYFILIIPVLAFFVSSFHAHIPASIEPFIIPGIAILACISCIRLAPMTLLLLFPQYDHFWEALLIPVLWLIVTPLMDNMNSRIDDEYIPAYIRGVPLRLISLGILYHVFHPLSFI